MKRVQTVAVLASSFVATIAAGLSFPAHAAANNQIASVPILQTTVSVTAQCEGDRANFRIHNTGDRMAEQIVFRVEKANTGEVVAGRKLLMKGNQVASFIPRWPGTDTSLRLVMETSGSKGVKTLSEIDCRK